MPALTLVFLALVVVSGLAVLARSAQTLIASVTRLGHGLGLSQFITGFILLGVATSTPEIFIAINSALSGTPELSLGNLFGANVVLLTLIAGSIALLNHGIIFRSDVNPFSRIIQTSLLILSPIIFLLDFRLSRFDGLCLLVLYSTYLAYLYHVKSPPPDHSSSQPASTRLIHDLAITSLGLLGILVSSKVIVSAVIELTRLLHVPAASMGTIILSLGTNLPEISIAFAALKKHEPGLVIGDCLGSAATNTFIVSLLALISPFALSGVLLIQASAAFVILSLVAFVLFTRTGHRISPREGTVLLSLYLGFITSQVLLLFTPVI